MQQLSYCVAKISLKKRGVKEEDLQKIINVFNIKEQSLSELLKHDDLLHDKCEYPELASYLCTNQNIKELLHHSLQNTQDANASMRLLTESKTILKTMATGKYEEPKHNEENNNQNQSEDEEIKENTNNQNIDENQDKLSHPIHVKLSQLIRIVKQDIQAFQEGKPINYSLDSYKQPDQQNEEEFKDESTNITSQSQMKTIEHDDELEDLENKKADIEIDLDGGDDGADMFQDLLEKQEEDTTNQSAQDNNQDPDSDQNRNVEEEHLSRNQNNVSRTSTRWDQNGQPIGGSRNPHESEISPEDDYELELIPNQFETYHDYGTEYLEIISKFIDEERDVHQDCIKNFCGLIRTLISEHKLTFLKYMLIQKKSQLLFNLLPFLNNQRFEFLLRTFLKDLQIVEDKHNVDFEWDIGGDNQEEPIEEKKVEITQEEQELKDSLDATRLNIILKLYKNLDSSTSNIHLCLTAQQYLLSESKSSKIYPLMIKQNNIKTLIQIACDFNNKFQQYALNVLSELISVFPQHDQDLDLESLQDFQQVIGTHFLDLTYSCLLILRSLDPETDFDGIIHTNQAGSNQKRLGIRRLRALELIYQGLRTLQKYEQFDKDILISPILRKQFLKGVLYVMQEYEYSNVGLQVSYKIIVSILDLYEEEDVETIIEFIFQFFNEDRINAYQSGRNLEHMNQANICKLTFTIARLIDGQQIYPLPDKKKDRYDEQIDFDSLCPKYEKFRENTVWQEFRENKLQPLATRWNKEIVEYIKERELALQQQRAESGDLLSNSDDNRKSSGSDGNLQPLHAPLDKPNDEQNKDKLDNDQLYGDNEDLGMLIKQYKGSNSRRDKQRTLSVDFKIPKALIPSDEDLNRKNFRDDWGLRQSDKDRYFDNNYWKVPESYSIDQLLQMENEQHEDKKE
eukprot:403375977